MSVARVGLYEEGGFTKKGERTVCESGLVACAVCCAGAGRFSGVRAAESDESSCRCEQLSLRAAVVASSCRCLADYGEGGDYGEGRD